MIGTWHRETKSERERDGNVHSNEASEREGIRAKKRTREFQRLGETVSDIMRHIKEVD